MQLAHAVDQRLSRIRVGAHAEGGVLLRQTGQRVAHLVLVVLGARFDRYRNHRLGEDDVLQQDRLVNGAERIAGEGVLQAHGGHDVARVRLLNLLARVGVHGQQAAEALVLTLAGVQYRFTRGDLAGVDAQVSQPAGICIRHNLENESRERLVVGGQAFGRLAGTRRRAGNRRNVDR